MGRWEGSSREVSQEDWGGQAGQVQLCQSTSWPTCNWWICQDMIEISENKPPKHKFGQFFKNLFIYSRHSWVSGGRTGHNWGLEFSDQLESVKFNMIYLPWWKDGILFLTFNLSEWNQASLQVCSKSENSQSLSEKLKNGQIFAIANWAEKSHLQPYKDKESPGQQMDSGAVWCRLWQNFLSPL